VWADGFWWYRWHPDAGIGFTREWEKPIEDYILRSGACFVDVGSHVGRWAVRASPFYRKVLAFEPDPFTNTVLRRNIARNDIHNVLVFATALSNRGGQATLFNYGPPACNSLRSMHVSGRTARASKVVEVRKLDDFADYFQAPLVLKIDVEGEELKVLEGASAILEHFRPVIVMEVHFQNEIGLITDEINKRGYNGLELLRDRPDSEGIAHLVARPGN
jgi:FkbM family methyltransferase